MDCHQNYLREIDIFFSGKQQSAIWTDGKFLLLSPPTFAWW